MFIASTAFLPSAFSMCAVMLSFGFWFARPVYHLRKATTMAAASVVVGWPFSGLLFVRTVLLLLLHTHAYTRTLATDACVVQIPLGLAVLRQYGLKNALLWASTALVLFVRCCSS